MWGGGRWLSMKVRNQMWLRVEGIFMKCHLRSSWRLGGVFETGQARHKRKSRSNPQPLCSLLLLTRRNCDTSSREDIKKNTWKYSLPMMGGNGLSVIVQYSRTLSAYHQGKGASLTKQHTMEFQLCGTLERQKCRWVQERTLEEFVGRPPEKLWTGGVQRVF